MSKTSNLRRAHIALQGPDDATSPVTTSGNVGPLLRSDNPSPDFFPPPFSSYYSALVSVYMFPPSVSEGCFFLGGGLMPGAVAPTPSLDLTGYVADVAGLPTPAEAFAEKGLCS